MPRNDLVASFNLQESIVDAVATPDTVEELPKDWFSTFSAWESCLLGHPDTSFKDTATSEASSVADVTEELEVPIWPLGVITIAGAEAIQNYPHSTIKFIRSWNFDGKKQPKAWESIDLFSFPLAFQTPKNARWKLWQLWGKTIHDKNSNETIRRILGPDENKLKTIH